MALRKNQLAAVAILAALVLLYVPIPFISGKEIGAIVLVGTAAYLFIAG